MAQKNVTRDMTQGSPLKLILTFSLPLLGGFLFQQLYSFMDTTVSYTHLTLPTIYSV